MLEIAADEVRDLWEAELAAAPAAAGGGGSPGEPLLRELLRTTSIPLLRPDPGRTWLWSDPHLGDRAMLGAWNRPFRDVEHMNRNLLAHWRRRVRPGDTLICLGDVAHPDALQDPRFELDLRACPGERLLILGNHDVGLRAELAGAGFDVQHAAAVCDTRPVLVLTHLPLRRVPPTAVNAHGHLHDQAAPTPRHRNLSVERTGYAPVRLDEVLADASQEPEHRPH